MAYNVNIVCDRCGEELVAWKNQSITIGKAKRIAKGAGWYITDDQEWFCQECGDTVERAEKILMGELWEQEGSEGEKIPTHRSG